MDSCRNLIENIVKKLSSASDWNVGLSQLIQSSTRKDLVKKVHAFLSAYGVHGIVTPSQKDTELGLKMTEDIISWILK